MDPICTLLVDDNGDFLDAAERLLSLMENIMVIGRATSGAEALEQVRRLKPDLVLMDWSMPGMSGLEATRHLKSGSKAPCIFMVTVHDAPRYRTAAEEAGADGFLPKVHFQEHFSLLMKQLFS